MNWLVENLALIWTLITTCVTVASLVVKLTPTKKDDQWFKKFRNSKAVLKFYEVMNLIALNPKK